MPNDIKNLLDGIINDTNASFPVENNSDESAPGQTFDSGAFREKMSLYVLKDIICAMLDENPKDVDSMVDTAIMNHIKDNYDGSCYGYLCNARDKLGSPEFNVFGNIIQEIDRKTACAVEQCCRTKNNITEAAEVDVKEMLDGVQSYDDLRNKLTKEVSQQVVDDVTSVITKSSQAPSFTDIDEKISVEEKPESAIKPEGTTSEDENQDTTTESYILRMVGDFVTESAINGEPITTEEGIDKAIVYYCLARMDQLCKQRPRKFYLGK